MLWVYVKEVAKASYDFAMDGADVIEFIICGIVFFLPDWLSKREEKGIEHETSVRKILWHKFLTQDRWRFFITGVVLVTVHCLIIAPFIVYQSARDESESEHDRYTNMAANNAKLQKRLEEKNPKLNGFVNRILVADEPGTSNSLVFLEATIGNSGETASLADDYRLKIVTSKDSSTSAEEIYFSDEYKMNLWYKGNGYLLDLKRPELLSEKTHTAIRQGESPRGWMAFRVEGIPKDHYQLTNIVLSFLDIHYHRTFVTNGAPAGSPPNDSEPDAITAIFPGSDNIFYPIVQEVGTNTGWVPPELPPGCSNVMVCFGANGIVYSKLMAEISPEAQGTKFAIKDLPDFYLSGLDKMSGYTPRQKYMWIRDEMRYTIGDQSVPYPVQPVIISNRLYVEVEIPFVNEKRKIVMSDDFDPQLPIPPLWDRNYSTNYDAQGNGIYAYEVVNELTNPVLQVMYASPNEVHINGIFQVGDASILESFGQQPQLVVFRGSTATKTNGTQRITTVSLQATNFSEIIRFFTNDSPAEIGQIITNEFYRPIFPGQRAIFKYPSNRHLGGFADWLSDTNTSDAKLVDKK